MAKECEKISKFSSKISKPTQKLRFEIDESYFGSKRVRGLVLALSLRKEVEAQQNKTPVFGMLKRDGKVYTQIVKNVLPVS